MTSRGVEDIRLKCFLQEQIEIYIAEQHRTRPSGYLSKDPKSLYHLRGFLSRGRSKTIRAIKLNYITSNMRRRLSYVEFTNL